LTGKRRESMKKILGGAIFVVALTVAVLVLRGNVAHVQPMHDHYKVYNVDGPPLPAPIEVTLKDQFATRQGVVEHLRMFSPPVEKALPTGGISPIIHPENHLAWYVFQGTCQERTLLVTNQFGTDQEWVVKDPVYLLLPAWKLYVNGLPTGLDHPSGLDHYLCYEVLSGPPVGLDGVILSDQFHQENVTVGDPMLLCNPVEKTLPGGTSFPIIDRENHLACYDISPHEPLPFAIHVVANDQFGDSQFVILENQFLCAPSEKRIKPPPGSCTP
jgi:hypothetical protein